MDDIEIVLPAISIPFGSTVRKVAGTTHHYLKQAIRIHQPKDMPARDIVAKPGMLFLMSHSETGFGSITEISDQTKLVVIMSPEDAASLLDDMISAWQDAQGD